MCSLRNLERAGLRVNIVSWPSRSLARSDHAADTYLNTSPSLTNIHVDRAFLLDALAEAFEGPAWHGPSLRSSIKGVSADEARWRPGKRRNSIWDLVVHAAYGKYLVASRLEPDVERDFGRKLAKAWWPRLPERTDGKTWREDQQLLAHWHQALLEACGRVPEARLRETRLQSRFTLAGEVHGLALHDVYHAGQIRLVRRLYADSR